MIWAFDHFHEGSINAGLFGLSDLRVVQTQAILYGVNKESDPTYNDLRNRTMNFKIDSKSTADNVI